MTIRRLLNYWFKKKRTGFYLWMGTGAAVLYFVGVMLDSSRSPGLTVLLRRLGFSGFVVVITAFFAHLNLHCVHWFLDHFKDTDHLPKRQMALVNSFCMTLFLCLCLGALPGTAWALEPLWQAIRQWFAGRAGLEDSVYPTLPMKTEAMESPDLSQLLGEAKPTPGWVLTADQVLRAAAIILVAVVLLMAVRAALRGIWAWVTRPRQFDSDEKIYLTPTWALASGDKAKAGIRLRFSPRSPSAIRESQVQQRRLHQRGLGDGVKDRSREEDSLFLTAMPYIQSIGCLVAIFLLASSSVDSTGRLSYNLNSSSRPRVHPASIIYPVLAGKAS